MFWLAALANVAAALLLGRHWLALWRQRLRLPLLTRFGLLILAVHLLTAAAILWPGFWQWSAGTQLRVFFLHDFLLGWVSSTLLGVLLNLGDRRLKGSERYIALGWSGGVAVMLLALLGVGFLQFNPIPAVTWFWLAAWSSVPLATVALWVWMVQLHRP